LLPLRRHPLQTSVGTALAPVGAEDRLEENPVSVDQDVLDWNERPLSAAAPASSALLSSVRRVRSEGAAEPEQLPPAGTLERLITGLIVVGPLLGLAFAMARLWGVGLGLRDVIMALIFYGVVGHGVTVGFHRLLTHRSFSASRALKVVLAVLGSMAFQGGPIGWVADHRRHHRFSDRPGDLHSPQIGRAGVAGQLAGFWHAHVGWLFTHTRTSWRHYAADLLKDRDVVMVNRLFPVWCLVSLGLPFGIGWLFGGLAGGLSALLWAGAVRTCVLHHVTWTVNSLCHMFGRRPFRTRDASTNIAVLSVLSFGESWHNGHHAFPRSARHGPPDPRRGAGGRAALLLAIAAWELLAFFSSPRRDHPTLSSIADRIMSVHAGRALVFAAWFALGVTIGAAGLRRRSS
jgi:stearoyl-CoA desaturase (delta-9 desaturase)